MPKNEAAWLVAKHGPLEVGDAPYIAPGPGEILVRNHAVAVNPVDWAIPYAGGLMFGWIKRPFVLGSDLAGEVAAVGEGVTGFQVGDRVLAMAAGMIKQRNRAAEGAFQAYSIVVPRLTTPIPDHIPFADAAVVPLGLTTAACGLYQDDLLALARPTVNPTAIDQWVIIMGGATSVGSNAVQLAAASGYKVIATASAKNFDYVRSLGAAEVFDYNSKDLVAEMIAGLQGREIAGTLAIGAGSAAVSLDILPHCRGRKFVANCSAPFSFDAIPAGRGVTLSAILKILPTVARAGFETSRKAKRLGITVKFYDASSMVDHDAGRYIFGEYLGPALAAGAFRPAPPPRIVGSSLRDIQTALDTQRKGVSASKIVVTLD